MRNPFFNSEENRLRSIFRVLLFIFLFVFMMVIPSLIPNTALDYIVRSVLTLGLFYIMFRYVDGRPWSFSGLKLDNTWIKECLAGIVMAALAMGLIFLTLWQTGGLEITSFSWNRSGDTFWLIPLLIFFVQMASVGFYEEVMARGYLLPNITEGFTLGNITPQKAAIIAVIISSGIFGLGHAGNPNANITAVVNIVLAGVMLAVPFIITGRLGLSVGIHFSWNFFQGGIFGFRVSGMEVRNSLIQIQQGGPDWWTGGSFGPEAGLIGVLGILLILGLTMLYLKQSSVRMGYADLFSNTFSEQKKMAEKAS
ncbi:CPBP family intramembrane glutamic endopeptidase [Gracilimonas sp. BCB1]|uniref:CPBP family intramembrane glutamic endopeptidase n=1 Tax=Gracilimonas sp. BCB1 TaxID=3152362 RepID=UPI0032D963FE